MGKGLSPLQKTILQLAYENQGRQTPQTDVTYSEILVKYFGWELVDNSPSWASMPWYQQSFSKNDIGQAEYGRAMASVSRAVKRLQERGLIEKTHSLRAGGWSGANLTEVGKTQALRGASGVA